MSVVVAIKKDNHIIVGCDSQVSCGNKKYRLTTQHNKAWYVDDCPNAVMAFTGGLRAGQLVQVTPGLLDETARLKGEIDFYYMVTEMFSRICALYEHYRIIPKDDVLPPLPCSFIVAYQDNAWHIDMDGAVTEIDDYLVMGSGEEVAMGVLENSKGEDPIERIKNAIKACSDKTIYVDGNVCIFSTAEEEMATDEQETK